MYASFMKYYIPFFNEFVLLWKWLKNYETWFLSVDSLWGLLNFNLIMIFSNKNHRAKCDWIFMFLKE